jgi:hypothetical protein
MKVLSTLLAILILATSCQNSRNEEALQSFIPGVYVKFGESEYSKAWDTLEISEFNEVTNTYSIDHRVGFQSIIDGRLQPKDFTSERYVAVLNPTTFQLQDPSNGKLFTFSLEYQSLLVNSAEYKKVK